jgi:hypothetical protein
MRHRPPSRPSLRLAAIGMALLAPTPERLTHGRVSRATQTVADAEGAIGLPWLAETPLARLHRRGDIAGEQRRAGEEFQGLFRLAALDPLRAGDMGQRLEAPTRPGLGTHGEMVERARRRVMDAIDALGGMRSPAGCAAWFIVGLELSVADWARREGWGGRPVSPHVAKGVLIGALGTLAAHFGIRADTGGEDSA